MRWVHRIKVRMLCKQGDVQDEVVAAVRDFARVEPKVERVEESANEIISADVAKESQQNEVLKRLVAGLGEQAGMMAKQVDSRLHEEEGDWNFYLRLDKAAYLKDRAMILTEGGNCLHVKLTLAVYPKKREVAHELVRRLFHLG